METPLMKNEKRVAAHRACDRVTDGMVIGMGTGSTVRFFLERLSERVGEGLEVLGVPTSVATERLALELGIPVTDLSEHPVLDLDIDGADEISPSLDLIKGGGGALMREKVVADASETVIIIADGSKTVEVLGAFPLPVEVLPFGIGRTLMELENAGCKGRMRLSGDSPFMTDNGNNIIDCAFGSIADPGGLERDLLGIPGVLECGLFVGLADVAIVAVEDDVKVLEV
jgi:ribose 5-phosphate isomerase A